MAIAKPRPTPIWMSYGCEVASTVRFAHPAAHEELPSGLTSAAGDERAAIAAFENFFRQHEPHILGYLWRMSGEEQVARDLTQETFLRAWEHFSKVRSYERPDAWLFRVATRLALNHLRQRNRHAHRSVPSETDDAAAYDNIESLAERDMVLRTLQMLPVRDRAALVLHSVYGLSCADLANALHISTGAAKVRLWRGRERFRTCYVTEERIS